MEKKKKKVEGLQPWQLELICKDFLIFGAADIPLHLKIYYQNFHIHHLQIAWKQPVDATTGIKMLLISTNMIWYFQQTFPIHASR